MKRGILFLFFLFFFSINSLASVYAAIEIGNVSHSIEKQYSPKGVIKGWINISLDNEPIDSLFETGSGDKISLISLLGKSPNAEYSCNPSNCEQDYSAANGEQEKTFNLNAKESAMVGFRFRGNVFNINSVKFNIYSNSQASCYNQLKIDFFDDSETDMGNNKVSGGDCSFLKKTGCFNSSESTEEYTIGSTPYCQKIRLTESPGFKVGAWVKKVSGNRSITMSIYDQLGEEKTSCILPEASANGGEIYCDVEYLVTEQRDHYVCIYSSGGSGEYKIRGYSDSQGCGFYGIPVQPAIAAYQIFGEGKAFGAVGDLNITNSLPNGNALGELFKDYLIERYGEGIDCSSECVVPLKITAEESQTITLKGLQIEYEKDSGQVTEYNFYELSEKPAVISADFQKINLSNANFSVPDGFGNQTFILKLNGEEIFSEEILVETIPEITSLSPATAAAAYPTTFKVNVNPASKSAIESYEWDFGDGRIETTKQNSIVHTYSKIGRFNLRVTARDTKGLSVSKTFSISVESPVEAANTTLRKKLENLKKVKSQIKELPNFYQTSLDLMLNLTDNEYEISELQKEYASAFSDEDYIDIMVRLLKVRIPESVVISRNSDPIQFYPDKRNIDIDIVRTIGEEEGYGEGGESKYIDAILAWNQENIETKVSFNEISANYENGEVRKTIIFKVDIMEKTGLPYSSYIILQKPENLLFKEDYYEKEEQGYVYIPLEEPQKTIEFSTTEEIDFSELPLFISPQLSRLEVKEEIQNETGVEKPKWNFFILYLSLIIFAGIVGYVVLQEWYKRRYEDYLFSNKNNLYNLVMYIENSKRKGIDNNEISRRLKKAGWTSEQIRYVMRKYIGKRTGMFEIPIGKIIGFFKRKPKNPGQAQAKREYGNVPAGKWFGNAKV